MRRQARAALVLLAFSALACDRVPSQPGTDPELGVPRADWLAQEGMQVLLCGTGSGVPARDHAGPCTAVVAGGRLLVVDAGPGSWKHVALWGLPQEALAGVMLTRLDASTIGDLGEIAVGSWRAGRRTPLPVYGPPEVGRVVAGLTQAYGPDADARLAQHGAERMPPGGARLEARPLVALRDPERVIEEDELSVMAFPLPGEEGRPAVGYRIHFRGRSVAVCGATQASNALRAALEGVELLIHETQAAHLVEARAEALARAGRARDAQLLRDTLGARATPAQAVALAREVGAHQLVLTHLAPPLVAPASVRAFLRGPTEDWKGRVVLGEDGLRFALPPGEATIRVGALPGS